MLKFIKITVLFVCLGVVIVFATAGRGMAGSFRSERLPSAPASSRSLYLANCARCHGSDGKGGTEVGKLYGASDLTSRKVQRKSRKRLTSVIRNGTGSMPAFGKKLTVKELSALVSFVRAF